MKKEDETDLVWKALADSTRRAILDVLAEGPATTGSLVERFDGLSRTAVMKHMGILEQAGLLLVRREGRARWNYFNPVPIEQVCERWVRGKAKQTASAMLQLKRIAEQKNKS